MGISAFRTIAKVENGSYTPDEDILADSIDFSVNDPQGLTGTPANTMREIQIQFAANGLGVLEVSFDDGTTYFPVNNDSAINGLSTFTIFVDNTTLLNFKCSVVTSIILWIGG